MACSIHSLLPVIYLFNGIKDKNFQGREKEKERDIGCLEVSLKLEIILQLYHNFPYLFSLKEYTIFSKSDELHLN